MKFLASLSIILFPYIASAQVPPKDFRGLVDLFLDIIDILIVFVFALTFIVFIWGIMKAWILNAGDEEEIKKGKNLAIWGVIVLAVMSGIWGILSLLRYSFFGQF